MDHTINITIMKIAILDAYTDEPACLGVPPFISHYVRYVAGAILAAGHEPIYLTVDDWRGGRTEKYLARTHAVLVMGGAIVPGKYLRSMPASIKEINALATQIKGIKILGGPVARFAPKGDRPQQIHLDKFDYLALADTDALIFDLLNGLEPRQRQRTQEEWEEWPVLGAGIVKHHPDHPVSLIAELETYRGCIRYACEGCSFCIEPEYGRPSFRSTESIVAEVKALSDAGLHNFRLGAQTCFFSYNPSAAGGEYEPDPHAIEKLLSQIRKQTSVEVLHIDNANPAVIAEHPDAAVSIMKSIVKHCTAGNVLALGVESVDPTVIQANNLNSTAEQSLKAIQLINEHGSRRGSNGMPHTLPGINFLGGLKGETAESYAMNYEFLEKVLASGLLLRRINIRQVASTRREFKLKHRREFRRFKEKVRESIDNPMLQRMLPEGTVIRDVYTEFKEGHKVFGRQLGGYPLLVCIPYDFQLNRFTDVAITAHGQRSVTGVEFPFNINHEPLSAVQALPGIGQKRAVRLVKARPFRSEQEVLAALDDAEVGGRVLPFIKL